MCDTPRAEMFAQVLRSARWQFFFFSNSENNAKKTDDDFNDGESVK